MLKGQRTFGANGTPATWFDGAVVTMEWPVALVPIRRVAVTVT